MTTLRYLDLGVIVAYLIGITWFGAFSVASIRGWWRAEGRRLYPRAERLLITADGGGSNGWRLRLWTVDATDNISLKANRSS